MFTRCVGNEPGDVVERRLVDVGILGRGHVGRRSPGFHREGRDRRN